VTTYPQDRKAVKYWATKFTKAVMASDAVTLYGPEVVLLAIWVASIEDKLRYTKPVKLWRSDISAKFNMHRNERVAGLLRDAAESGLIHRVKHPRGSKLQMAFWVLIPEWLEPYFNGPSGSENGTRSGT